MKRSAKNFIAMLVALAMIVTLVACGAADKAGSDQGAQTSESGKTAEGASGGTAQKEPITFTMMTLYGATSALSGVQNDPVSQEIAKQTGVTLDFRVGDAEKIKIALASSDLPDIMYLETKDLNNMITGKQVVSLEDLIKTNGQDILANAPTMVDFNRKFRSNNTNTLYCVSAMQDSAGTASGIWNEWLRWDYYKEMGYPEVKTLDDVFNLLVEMQKKHPTNAAGKKTYAFSGFMDYGIYFLVDSAIRGVNNVADFWEAPLTDTNSVFWQKVRIINKAQRLGILDPETFTQKYDDFQKKLTDGRYMGYGAHWFMWGPNGQFKTDGHPESGFMPLAPTEGSDVDNWYDTKLLGAGDRNAVITSSCKAPERAMDLLNYFWSYEGCRLAYNGIKGTNYAESNGFLNLTDDIWNLSKTDKDFGLKTGIGTYSNVVGLGENVIVPADGQKVSLWNDPKVLTARSTNMEANALLDDYCTHYNTKRYGDSFDKVDFAQLLDNVKGQRSPNVAGDCKAVRPDDIARIGTSLDNYASVNIPKLIIEAKSDAEFDAKQKDIIAALNKLGANDFYVWDKAENDKAVIESNKILGIK